MLVLENQREDYRHAQGIAREDEPRGRPPGRHGAHRALRVDEAVHHGLRTQGADRGADAVGHDHEKSLRRGADRHVGLVVHEERARDIEEVERHAVDDHREDEHPHAPAGVAQPEQSEAQHPREHGHKHHVLDPEALQAERDKQDAERLRHLRQRDQRIGVVGAERRSVFGYLAERGDERIGESVGNLQRHA